MRARKFPLYRAASLPWYCRPRLPAPSAHVNRGTVLRGIHVILVVLPKACAPPATMHQPLGGSLRGDRQYPAPATDQSHSCHGRFARTHQTPIKGSSQLKPCHAMVTIAKLLLATRGKTEIAFSDSGTIARAMRMQVLLIGNPVQSSRSATCVRMATRPRRHPHHVRHLVAFASLDSGTWLTLLGK